MATDPGFFGDSPAAIPSSTKILKGYGTGYGNKYGSHFFNENMFWFYNEIRSFFTFVLDGIEVAFLDLNDGVASRFVNVKPTTGRKSRQGGWLFDLSNQRFDFFRVDLGVNNTLVEVTKARIDSTGKVNL